MKKIQIADVTLKQLAKSRDVSLLFREKTAIAACADGLGVDAIELAPIQNLREDTIIYKTIAQNLRHSTLCLPVGFSADGVEAAWNCLQGAQKPCLQIEVPVSTVQMEYIHHVKADKMLAKIGELTSAAKQYCQNVEFIAQDATRADANFLLTAVQQAVNAGATAVTLCDDAGVALPAEIAAMVKAVKAAVQVPVFVQVSDSISLAVAAAIEAVAAGADGLKCAMVGNETLLMGKLCDAVNARGNAFDAELGLQNTKIHASIDDLLNSIRHQAYADSADAEGNNEVLLDADSTLAQVAQAAALLGYDLSDEDCGNVHKALAQVCEKKGSVGAKELEALIAGWAMQAPSTYHLEHYTANCSNVSTAMAQVTLKCGEDLLSGVSAGDGPIDAVFRAIEQCIGYHYELDDFQVQAVTEGKGALGSALVRLRNNGKLYSGNGTSTDIVAASIRAYINALNKIVFEEK